MCGSTLSSVLGALLEGNLVSVVDSSFDPAMDSSVVATSTFICSDVGTIKGAHLFFALATSLKGDETFDAVKLAVRLSLLGALLASSPLVLGLVGTSFVVVDALFINAATCCSVDMSTFDAGNDVTSKFAISVSMSALYSTMSWLACKTHPHLANAL